MRELATTIIIEHPMPVQWQAVLVAALPAFFAMVAALGAAVLGYKNHGKITVIDRKASSIDAAVNGTQVGAPTIRENVEAIDKAVNGASPGDPSIRQNVETLTARRDLDPNL